MTAPERPRRWLRPGVLHTEGRHLWVLDQTQPVAALVDLDTQAVRRLIDWSSVPPGSRPDERRAVTSAAGLWVQQPGGPVVLVDESDRLSGHHVGDLMLATASAHGAWAVDEPRAQDLAHAPDAPPAQYRGSGELRLARPGQVTTRVWVEAPVVWLHERDGDLWLEVEDGTWSRRPLGDSLWELVTGTRWLRLGRDEPVPERLGLDAYGVDAPPDGGRPRWWAGVDPEARRSTGLAGRSVLAAIEVEGTVWACVEESSADHPYHVPGPVAVVVVAPGGAAVEVVVPGDSIDITEHAWPLPDRPLDADDHAAFWRDVLSGLDACWTDPEGNVSPLSEGFSDSRVEVVGEWPRTELHLTFAWTRRPGVRLRRRIALFDDLGRAVEPEYAEIHVMEDLETGRVPPAPVPGADHLDM